MSLVMNYTTDKNPKSLVDSNILVYIKDKDDPKKQQQAESFINECAKKPFSCAITNQNLGEFARTTTEKMKVPIEAVQETVEEFLTSEVFTILDSWHINELSLALDLQKKFNMHFWDAKLAATMLSNNIMTIYTENVKDFENIPGITAINPFSPEA